MQRDLLTPIEKILSDEMLEYNISFKPLVKMGRFYVDFLVEQNKRKLIVECDGRDYHNPNLDKERDKELSEHNIPILRLTGSEIYWNPEKCIDKIQQSFRNQHRNTDYQIDKNLDESQSKPLSHITGPCRVLAPAGSGKTKTLVNRIAYLLNNNVDNDRILSLAFNKKAAEEITKRLSDNHIDVTNQMSNSGVVIIPNYPNHSINKWVMELHWFLKKKTVLLISLTAWKVKKLPKKLPKKSSLKVHWVF